MTNVRQRQGGTTRTKHINRSQTEKKEKKRGRKRTERETEEKGSGDINRVRQAFGIYQNLQQSKKRRFLIQRQR